MSYWGNAYSEPEGRLMQPLASFDAGLEEFTQARFRCESCRKSWAQRTSARSHRRYGCVSDPATRACKTCRHHGPEYMECAIDMMPHDSGPLRWCPGWEAIEIEPKETA